MPTKPPFAQFSRKARPDAWRDYDLKRSATPRLAEAARIRNTPAWREIRARFVALHPICGACEREMTRQVHHLIPIEKAPELAFTWENLAPVCTKCHSECNALERDGKSTDHLFANFVRKPAF